MADDIAVKIKDLHKSFKLPHERTNSIKGVVVNFWRREKGYEEQRVLKGISFDIKKGEFFGIVGRNGSGKSTLLKTMAGIYFPDKGSVKLRGKLVPFIELGVGFNPELSGRDNVFLNGSLLGFNRKEMSKMYKDIVEFAELEGFMDQLLKNYSSGMQVRLAFSIAIRARGDILLLDEVLAVGDSAFQQKCYDYFNSLKKEKRTIILVSHNMQIIDQFCDRALLLEQGEIKHMGSSSEVSNMYEIMFMREEAKRLSEGRKDSKKVVDNDSLFKVFDVKIRQAGKPVKHVRAQEDFEIVLGVKSQQDFDKVNVGVNIKNRDKTMVIATDTAVNIGDIQMKRGVSRKISFRLENKLTDGLYYVNIGVAAGDDTPQKVYLRAEQAQEFTVEGIKNHSKALIQSKVKVEVV